MLNLYFFYHLVTKGFHLEQFPIARSYTQRILFYLSFYLFIYIYIYIYIFYCSYKKENLNEVVKESKIECIIK